MIPTDEERSQLQEFQQAADDVVLGSAEQFLAMLCSIPDLTARLRLWAFKLDYETTESVSTVIRSLTNNHPFLQFATAHDDSLYDFSQEFLFSVAHMSNW